MTAKTDTERACNYQAGRAEGERWAAHDDTFARAAIREILENLRERFRTSRLESERAYWLGVLRGYRAVTR